MNEKQSFYVYSFKTLNLLLAKSTFTLSTHDSPTTIVSILYLIDKTDQIFKIFFFHKYLNNLGVSVTKKII